ncbi:phosphodiesterase [Trinickia caryophylli]|uniref:3',5'-cyclic AMP phosphodiesterase CpdA n=1 Tax=Trinickia caryophylli TaxID=28094 RepID=A0A1X7DZ47_TRICW|nr:phosphodiesterase [Trinickia caryophylli]PMS14152.1 phosphodiesterase [Trinickia caryophylli]TRX17848.1 phosphodiesterase [Trinickia caryophylli]WQE11384.1 phosphodiesterase [Trinickia caryophylli]SMF23857.1 3',5'-cyclic AMP phosphodiesterase CpdA [Trinickia caryophylli]GLU32542.1 3',5'-cyclic adenosine monophosphate phosphodiesterase CpdA [Trinickia caryophylli]
MLLAQISDLHIKRPGALAYRRVDTAAALARCVHRLNALDPRPDAIVITGDLVDLGSIEEYRHLAALLAPLRIPYYLLVGNHDNRAALREVFSDHAYLATGSEFVQYSVDIGPLKLVALDSQTPGQSPGTLCDARLAWLERALQAAAGAPVVVALHHPPFVSGIGHMDRQRLDPAAAERLAAVIARFPNVERVICGHVHRPIVTRFAGTIASAVPAPAHQVALDLRRDAPSAFRLEPPAFALHLLDDDNRLVTHHAYIDEGDGPYPFYEPNGRLID